MADSRVYYNDIVSNYYRTLIIPTIRGTRWSDNRITLFSYS